MSYCCAVDHNYDPQWFHRIIALKLEDVYRRVLAGESPRLMITMPPRHGKSDEATQKFPSWVLGHSPEFPIIVASYAAELATLFGQKTRDLMNSPNYQGIFSTRLREDTQAKGNWMTDKGGGYNSVGIGGPITGKGYKIGICDDPFKNFEESDSPVVRDNVWQWWRSTFYTRQEGNAAIILINTRWNEDDLSGRLEKDQEEAELNGEENFDEWEHLNFAAIAEKDEPPYRHKGEALWPQKFSLAKLERVRKALGPYLFAAMYQQNPYAIETKEFRDDWIKKRLWGDVQNLVTRKFATIDTALGKKRHRSASAEEHGNTPDYTGVTRNYVDLGGNWNLKSKRYEINSAQLIDLIFELHDEGFEVIGIEEGAYIAAIEPFLQKEMQKRGKYPNIVTLKHNQTMKETRIRGLIARYSANEVYHIVGECEDLEGEMTRFPHGAHDDCLDATAYQPQIAERPVLDEEGGGGVYNGTNYR
jgi:phage terminase large subunit-like protein